MQYYSASLKNDAILQRDTKKTMQYYSASIKNDAILVRGHKNRKISQ
jgi:hypothetical protein